MLRRYSRLLVALHVLSDALLGAAAFGLAYLVRFSSGLIPVIKGYPHLFVLDENGKLLRSQDTSVLEQGSSYDLDKMFEFLKKWAPEA